MGQKHHSNISDEEQMISSTIIDCSPVPIFVIDLGHRITHWNRACELITGVSAKEMIATTETWRPFYPESQSTLVDYVLEEEFQELESQFEDKCQCIDELQKVWEVVDFYTQFPGGGKWIVIRARLLTDPVGKKLGVVATLHDITEQRKSEDSFSESQHLLSQIIDGCPVPMLVIDENHQVTHWNRACGAILGTDASDVIGTNKQWKAFYDSERPILADLVLKHDTSELSNYYKGIWAESPLIEGAVEATSYFENFSTGPKWLYFTAAPLHDKHGQSIGAVETLQDVSEQKRSEEKLQHQAYHDTLTGLANRSLLNERLQQDIAHAEREGRQLAVLFIDLDDFKNINDTLGHNEGDKVIKHAAKSISKCVRSWDTVARLGGDEFVVTLFAPENADHVTHIIQRILNELSKGFSGESRELHVSSSIGVAMYPQDGKDVVSLMMNADSAMYQAKDNNKGSFCFFTKEMNERVGKRLALENDLHRALEEDQFELVYQPIYEMSTGKVIAAEALLRWNHPERGLILPNDFIGIAEDSGLIIDIGHWVLQTAIAEANFWKKELNQSIRISINVSPRQFYNNGIHEALEKMLGEFDLSSLDIELELTESLVMKDPEKAQNTLEQLHELGVKLAMDDFGTGYSSFAYLRRFPFDTIKIDRSFTKGLGEDADADAIVRAMLELGKILGLRMLAEGVETEMHQKFLENEGCDELQGFLFSKPLGKDAIRNMLDSQN